VVDDLRVQAPIEALPRFQTYVLQDYYVGEPFALGMHSDIFKKIGSWKKSGANVKSPGDLFPAFHTFLTTLAGYSVSEGPIKLNVAGKNFGNFDSKFLEKLPHYGMLFKFHHRILDPAMLYFDPKEDETLPDTKECMRRAGIDGEVQHTALDDALNVIKLLRKKYPRR